MSTLWLVLTPLLATWLPAGYLASGVWNALGFGCEHLGDFSYQSCSRNHEKFWDWNRPFASNNGPAYFALGVVLGWIMVVVFVFVVFMLGAAGLVVKLFNALGRRLAPRQSR